MASRWCTPTFCHQLFGHIHWYVRHPLVWECCKPFKRKQHKDTLGNNIKGLYEHSMWNCWCLACVEASRLGVLEATIFPTLQGNFAYAAKTWYQVTCQWYSDTYIYIYMLIYSDPIFQWYFNCFIHLLFCKPQNPRGWKCSSLSPLRWALRNRGVILSLLRGVGFSEKKTYLQLWLENTSYGCQLYRTPCVVYDNPL